jgi:UDP-N-acetyl-D-mannosaminuronic acid dehydrogenase
MKISIIGMGYIGLPTAAVLASSGMEVIGVDVNDKIIEIINSGKIHIVEPDLEELVMEAISTGKLLVRNTPESADIFVITVPTPIKENKEPDLSYVEAAIISIAPFLKKGNLVILESTSPVGMTERCIELLMEKRPEFQYPEYGSEDNTEDISIAYSPERVLPGQIVRELVENDRVIGGVSELSAIKADNFYKLFVKGERLLTDSRTAELCKLVENSFRDVNIAYANELSLIADHLDIDIWKLIKLANHHPRVNILQPGPGVGGHCIAVDPWFIVDSAPEQAKLIKQARVVNDAKPDFIITKVNEAIKSLDKEVSELSISCLGLSFKPNIDDLRESPALQVATEISNIGFDYQYLVEPNINYLPDEFLNKNCSLEQLDLSIEKSDIILVLVDHEEFRVLDKKKLLGKLIIDTKGIWNSL